MLEKFYQKEDYKYRHLRYALSIAETRKVLKELLDYTNLPKIKLNFKSNLKWKGDTAAGLFLCPELGRYKLQLNFDTEKIELLTVLHEFTHYYQYKNYKWGKYSIHGKQFYSLLQYIAAVYRLHIKDVVFKGDL
jgi:predicted SprT family Zn-dependent metalloprotease